MSATAQPPSVYVILGVSASGKSVVGAQLAAKLGCRFYDADDYHPEANIAKMKSGQPLTDVDRLPWLHTLAEIISHHIKGRDLAVLACSALKVSYRDILRQEVSKGTGIKQCHNQAEVAFVLLDPGRGELDGRLAQRLKEGKHFMPPALLDSQLKDLEKADEAEFHMHIKDGGAHDMEQGAVEPGCGTAAGCSQAPHEAPFPDVETIVGLIVARRT